jgi:hypothetical protein
MLKVEHLTELLILGVNFLLLSLKEENEETLFVIECVG